ncbi:recombinase RecT [Streptomyces uncialis]|uniref:recombinase RecT n=1 Tax=Streptomyces uncialis TaxID=1048205 RepID=UPI00364D903D
MSSLKDRVRAATTPDAPERGESDQAAGEASAPGVVDLAKEDTALTWLEERRSYFRGALPRHVDEAYFIQAAAGAMHNHLRNCDQRSLFRALMACAQFGLAPNGTHAAIVPFGQTATFVPMYQGLISCMHNSGAIDSVRVGFIREADEWDYTPTAPSPQDFHHKPKVQLPEDERGDIILAYAFAWMTGGGRSQVILLNRSQALEIRDKHSKAFKDAERKGKKSSAWHTNFDAQWLKSCIRRLAKLVPTSPEVVALLDADAAAEDGRPAPEVTVTRADSEEDDGNPEGGTASGDGDGVVDAEVVDTPADPGGPEDDDLWIGGWPEAVKPGSRPNGSGDGS